MGVLRLEYASPALKVQTRMVIVHPFDTAGRGPSSVEGVLVLLHGMLDGPESWLTQTTVAQQAARHGVLVVMPDGQRSFWRDMHSGGNYHRLVGQEIPQMVERVFGLAHRRERWAVAGNSMGGYGALYTALTSPGVYSICAAFSPVTDPVDGVDAIPRDYLIPGETRAIVGEDFGVGELTALACQKGIPVELTLACGTGDFLYGESEALHRAMSDSGRAHIFRTEEGAGHDWDFWNAELRHFLDSHF